MEISRTPYYIELTDAAGKKASGYLAGVGAGETLGSELVDGWTNHALYPFETWTPGAGSDITQAINLPPGGNQYGIAYKAVASPIGQLMKMVATINIASGGLSIGIGPSENNEWPDGGLFQLKNTTVGAYATIAPVAPNTFYNFVTIYTNVPVDFLLSDFSYKRVTDPPATSVHIVSSLNGITRNWENIESGFNPNTIVSWKLYDLAHPGMYLPSDGSTFNRGDFTAGNAFFWSSIDLSPYAGTLISADSLRQAIISAVDTRLKTILVTNGYKTDLGQNIFEWKTDPFQASEVDGLTYRDRTENRETGCGVYDLILPLEIEMISDSPAGIRKCLADLEKAVFVDASWGGLAYDTRLDTNEIAVEKKENLYAASNIKLSIFYRTIIGDPYMGA